jgi:hypothetical protein
MLAAIRLHTRVDSDILIVPELLQLVGQTVEIIILVEEEEPNPVEVASGRTPRLGTLRGKVEIPDDPRPGG